MILIDHWEGALVVLELRLSVEDLARVRVIGTLGMAFEAHMAWARLGEQRRDALTEWRRAARHRLRRVSAAQPVAEPATSLLESLTSPVPRDTDPFPRWPWSRSGTASSDY